MPQKERALSRKESYATALGCSSARDVLKKFIDFVCASSFGNSAVAAAAAARHKSH